jgi:hypothetical protein
VEGLLCGRTLARIPASHPRGSPAMAEIILINDAGVRVRSPIVLAVSRPHPLATENRLEKSSRVESVGVSCV